MSESTAPHPIYNPDEYTRSDTPPPAAQTQPRQLPNQCPAGELPARWIVGLYGATTTTTASSVTVDIEGLRVMVSVVRHTADMQQISAVYLQLRTVVRRYTHVRAGISVIAPDLPPQVASAQWRTEAGEVTLIRPRPGRRQRRKRLPGRLLGMSPLLAVCAWWAHKASTSLRGTGGAVAAMASVVTIAGVTAIGPAAPPPSVAPSSPPHPARSRQADLLDAPSVLPPSPGLRPTATPQPAATPSASPQPDTTPSAATQAADQPSATPTATPTTTPTATPSPVVTVTTPVKTHLPAVHLHPTKHPHPAKTKKAILPTLPSTPVLPSALTP